MTTSTLLQLFGKRLRELRENHGLSQERLAILSGLHRTHINLIERGKRIVRLDTILRLANALKVDCAELVWSLKPHKDDRVQIHLLQPFLRRFQELATKNGIDDVFQDNGGKLLQTLLITGLTRLPGREGNDARDHDGLEYELKSLNILLTKSFSTHHHLNSIILSKYRSVAAWYFSIYEHIELKSIYKMTPKQLEPIFKHWESKFVERRDLNNPKIPVTFVIQNGELIYMANT